MPYGQDFLDIMNDILPIDEQLRRRIQTSCTECHGKTEEDWNKRGRSGSYLLTCEACKKAKLVDWDGYQYTSAGIDWYYPNLVI